MRSFQFRLGRVMRMKNALEKQQLFSLQKVENNLRQSLDNVKKLEKTAGHILKTAEVNKGGEIGIDRVTSILHYVDFLDGLIKEKKGDIEGLNQKVLEARKKVLVLMRERKVIENLKNRMILLHRREVSKKVQRQHDGHSSWHVQKRNRQGE